MQSNFSAYTLYCPKDHPLKWSQSYLTLECPLCHTKDMNYSRWECLICKEKYCVSCKKPQVFDNKCPLNHKVLEKQLFSNKCDGCRKSINGKGFRDEDCDLDLCEKCMNFIVKED